MRCKSRLHTRCGLRGWASPKLNGRANAKRGGGWRGVIDRDLIGYVEGECRSKAESVVKTKRTNCSSDGAEGGGGGEGGGE